MLVCIQTFARLCKLATTCPIQAYRVVHREAETLNQSARDDCAVRRSEPNSLRPIGENDPEHRFLSRVEGLRFRELGLGFRA